MTSPFSHLESLAKGVTNKDLVLRDAEFIEAFLNELTEHFDEIGDDTISSVLKLSQACLLSTVMTFCIARNRNPTPAALRAVAKFLAEEQLSFSVWIDRYAEKIIEDQR